MGLYESWTSWKITKKTDETGEWILIIRLIDGYINNTKTIKVKDLHENFRSLSESFKYNLDEYTYNTLVESLREYC